MPDALSSSTQDYLKCVWTLQEWNNGAVSITALAEKLGLQKSTVSDGVRKLVQAGLLEHEHYGGVTLTPTGAAHAVAMVRRHRLLETYLVSELGYAWDEVHDEAEVLEHAVSERLIAALDARLGHPTRDPHGDPIPSIDGAANLPPAVPLADAPAGMCRVARISDADPDRLRRFAQAGVTLDAWLTVDRAGAIVSPQGEALDNDDVTAVWVIPA